jgi:drug/metabolite transporter (DMT)-like permease
MSAFPAMNLSEACDRSMALQSENWPASSGMLWLIYALAAAVIWGINYAVSGRLLEKGLSPQALFFIDLVFGTAAVGMVITLTGKWNATVAQVRALSASDLAWLLVAVAAATAAGLLIFLSIGAKNATLASLIEVTYPIFTALFAWVLFRQATLNGATLLGALLIFAGVITVARANAAF